MKDSPAVFTRVKHGVVRSVTVVKSAFFALRMMVEIFWPFGKTPDELTCRRCGYEGSVERTMGRREFRVGLEEFDELDGQQIPMWMWNDDDPYCYPCMEESVLDGAPEIDPGATAEKMRRLQEAKDDE